MASGAIQLYGPRGEKLKPSYYGARSNNLYAAATQTTDRKQVSLLDYDVHRSVSNYGRRTLMTLGRHIYANVPAVRGAIREQAEYASSIFLPQFYGANQDWGQQAEAWIENHDKICDVAGWPYNMRLYRRNLIVSVLRDGDMLTVLVKQPNGFPMLQCIPGHRVGWRYDEECVRGGPYDGARIIDGVILNDSGATLAHRVITSDDPYSYESFVDVPARDSFLSYLPDFVGQHRGFSAVGMAAFPIQDIAESDNFELLAQKLAASIALIEKNEEGEAQPGDADGFPIRPNPDAPKSDYAKELVTGTGVTVRYLRSGDPNTSLETLKTDRPTANQQSFRHNKLRDIFAGMDWSIDFALDPSKVGGASMRVVVEKINRSIKAIQDLCLEPACARFDGFRVSSAIQMGVIPDEPEWWKWTYQGPARLTADAKYDSEIDLQETERGLQTDRGAIAKRGSYYEDNYKQRERESDMKWAAAKRLADKYDLDISAAYNSLWNPSPNGLASWMDSDIDAPPSGKGAGKKKKKQEESAE